MTQALLLAGLVLLVGALIQGVVGYGMNLLAAPPMLLLDPSLVPIPVLLLATVHASLGAIRERRHTHWPGVGWAMVGRVPGNALGMVALAALPLAGFTIAVAASVLVCVGLSLVAWRPRPTPGALVVAGTASGAFGTTSAIGGPPIALVYQHSPGPTTRATLSIYFLLASVSSLVMLALAGQLHAGHLRAALILLPFMLAGFALSSPARRLVDGGRLRIAVLAVAVAGAVALLVRTVTG